MTDGFDAAYETLPPWDIGRPQDAVAALVGDGRLDGRVLDVGCGTGEHALLAAAHGHDSWGIDSAPAAIERARRKATRHDRDVAFRVHDALDLPALGERFDTALDVGLFHALPPDVRTEYAASLRDAVAPGGTLYLHCLSERDPHESGPHRVSVADIERAFAGGWRVASVDPAPLVWRHLPRPRRGYLATIRRP